MWDANLKTRQREHTSEVAYKILYYMRKINLGGALANYKIGLNSGIF